MNAYNTVSLPFILNFSNCGSNKYVILLYVAIDRCAYISNTTAKTTLNT